MNYVAATCQVIFKFYRLLFVSVCVCVCVGFVCLLTSETKYIRSTFIMSIGIFSTLQMDIGRTFGAHSRRKQNVSFVLLFAFCFCFDFYFFLHFNFCEMLRTKAVKGVRMYTCIEREGTTEMHKLRSHIPFCIHASTSTYILYYTIW